MSDLPPQDVVDFRNFVVPALPTPWLMVNRLRGGDRVEVRLRDRVYMLEIIKPAALECVMAEGKQRLGVYVMGSYVDRAIQLGVIGVGHLLELVVEGRGRVCALSPVQEVWVNGVRALPESSPPLS